MNTIPKQKKLNLEIPSGDLALADLLVKHCGWEWYGGVKHALIKDFGFAINVTDRGYRDGFRDLNALRQVWKELKELLLWFEFLAAWRGSYRNLGNLDSRWLYLWLNDPEGQVEAAIEVLRKHFE